jgi:hypothetical protein
MADGVHAGDCRGHHGAISHVSLDQLRPAVHAVAKIEDPDGVTAGDELLDDDGADEPGAAGYQDLHAPHHRHSRAPRGIRGTEFTES